MEFYIKFLLLTLLPISIRGNPMNNNGGIRDPVHIGVFNGDNTGFIGGGNHHHVTREY